MESQKWNQTCQWMKLADLFKGQNLLLGQKQKHNIVVKKLPALQEKCTFVFQIKVPSIA